MQIIGLGAYSRVGKDSLANYLVTAIKELNPSLRVLKRSLAWKLKDVCYQLYAWDGLQPAEFYDTPEGEKYRDIKLPTIGKTPVEIWVAFGTPAVRENVYDRTWLDYLLKGTTDVDVLIVPDVRFGNEFEAFLEANGLLGKVVRPGYGPRNTVADLALISETRWNFIAGASGKMSELEQWAHRIARHIVYGTPLTQSDEDKRAALAVEKRAA